MPHDQDLSAIERSFRQGGAEAACAELCARLNAGGQLPELFDALQLRDRQRRSLPLLGKLDLEAFPAAQRGDLEHDIRSTCREVGEIFLARGDLAGAWPYFQNIREFDAMAVALEAWRPLVGDERNRPDVIVKIAFGQGAHPVRGYELLLEHFGTCEGIGVLEQAFPYGPHVRRQCIRRLIRHFHRELRQAVGGLLGAEHDPAASLTRLLELYPERIAGAHCPVDDSHLQAVLRSAAQLEPCAELDAAVELAHYGARLAPGFQRAEPAPFEDFYADYRILLAGLAGREVARAVEHFTRKVGGAEPAQFAVEILVLLLHRSGQAGAALQWSRQHLRAVPRSLGVAPTYPELCLAAAAFEELQSHASERGDLVLYTAALLGQARGR